MIEIHLIDLTDPGSRIDLYTACLKLRREVFISSLGWNLHETVGCEFDQYDFPASIHIAATKGDQLVGCMRMLRTDSDHSGTTYMILDAHRGKIPNLPSGIMAEELVSDRIWEASRLAISTVVPTTARNEVLHALIDAGRDYVIERGGVAMLGMMNPVFRRIFRRVGHRVDLFGPVSDQRDGKICVLRWDFEGAA
ncbi:GNAT family N-acetyltransferase [Phaeobacter inhibens]|uniref:acyl-homoserine-lactone synthase n=1 Tax=Phaeobacter inhibens TaxID=221822 RepID=UPI0021A5999C|nr:acyl-homoserine-lactone synthase [Phaeobacter inhibens]UWR67051.1 GNAT family N-acetyltransferase [Phaeobacter inhibens]